MNKTFLVVTVLTICSISVFCYSDKTDSLLIKLDNATEDSVKTDILNELGMVFYKLYQQDSALMYIDQAIHLAEANAYKGRLAYSYFLKARNLMKKGELESGKSNFERSRILYEQKGDKAGIFKVYLYLGDYLSEDQKVNEAIEYFDSAKQYLDNRNTEQVSDFNYRLGNFFWYQGQIKKARNYYALNLENAIKSGDSTQYYYALADLGSIYNDLGLPDSAVYCLKLAIPKIEQIDKIWAACLKGCLGTCYKSLGDCKNAIKYLKEGLDQAKSMGDDAFDCSSYADLAICYLQEGDLEKGMYYNDLAISLINDAKDSKLKRDAFKEIVNFYKSQGLYEQAFINLELLQQLKDTISSSERLKAVEELQVKFQTAEQKNQLEVQNLQLKNQQTLISGSIALLLLLLVLIFLGIWLLRYRKRKNTLLAEKNQQLLELDRAKSRFFSNISHELRTPLTLVVAPLYEALEKAKNSVFINDLQLAYANSQKLSVLVDEILDLSKLENGQMKLHHSVIRLDEVIRRIFFAFESLAYTQRIRLNYESSLPEDLWIKTDFPKLEKILNNLVSNAVKYSKKGGEVSCFAGYVPSGENAGQLTIKVIDQGVGISERDLPRIFDRFYQGDENPLMGGTGIGLALTKELVELFKGQISAVSEQGRGSTFTVVLQLEEAMPESKSQKEELPVVSEEAKVKETSGYVPILLNGEKPKILIVEDNPEMSRFLKQSLSKNYETKVAYNGTEGLESLEREHFDLVTSDVMMPEMDGFQFLENLRKQGTSFCNVPVVMLTARSLEADKLEGFQLGVDDYVTKPFSIKELVARIDNLLKNQQTRKNLDGHEKDAPIESTDRQMLKAAEKIVLEKISDPEFGVQELASALAVSQRSLVRLINRLAGMSPVSFIREIRLQKAYQFLKRRQFMTVAEVRFEVGIEHASYFHKKFKERFGLSPREVLGKRTIK